MRCLECDERLVPGETECAECGATVRKQGMNYTLTTLLVISLIVTVAAMVLVPFVIERREKQTVTGAIGALKTIAVAQTLFRESDRERDGNLDYAALSELAQSGLVDSLLGSGTKNGYIFETTYSSTTSEFLWFATARPESSSGSFYLCTNQSGVTFYRRDAPFEMNSIDCTIPASVQPVGR